MPQVMFPKTRAYGTAGQALAQVAQTLCWPTTRTHLPEWSLSPQKSLPPTWERRILMPTHTVEEVPTKQASLREEEEGSHISFLSAQRAQRTSRGDYRSRVFKENKVSNSLDREIREGECLVQWALEKLPASVKQFWHTRRLCAVSLHEERSSIGLYWLHATGLRPRLVGFLFAHLLQHELMCSIPHFSIQKSLCWVWKRENQWPGQETARELQAWEGISDEINDLKTTLHWLRVCFFPLKCPLSASFLCFFHRRFFSQCYSPFYLVYPLIPTWILVSAPVLTPLNISCMKQKTIMFNRGCLSDGGIEVILRWDILFFCSREDTFCKNLEIENKTKGFG